MNLAKLIREGSDLAQVFNESQCPRLERQLDVVLFLLLHRIGSTIKSALRSTVLYKSSVSINSTGG